MFTFIERSLDGVIRGEADWADKEQRLNEIFCVDIGVTTLWIARKLGLISKFRGSNIKVYLLRMYKFIKSKGKVRCIKSEKIYRTYKEVKEAVDKIDQKNNLDDFKHILEEWISN